MRSFLGLLPATMLLSGCLIVAGGKETVFDEASRLRVRFESVAAAHDFEGGFRSSSRDDFTDGGGFGIPFLIAGGGITYHETQHYNAQVRLADIDRDGLITEAEAAAYRSHVGVRADQG